MLKQLKSGRVVNTPPLTNLEIASHIATWVAYTMIMAGACGLIASVFGSFA